MSKMEVQGSGVECLVGLPRNSLSARCMDVQLILVHVTSYWMLCGKSVQERVSSSDGTLFVGPLL